MTSMRRNDVASTSFRRHVPTRFLINQCQIITFLIKIWYYRKFKDRIERNSFASTFKSNYSCIYYYFTLQLGTFVIFSCFTQKLKKKVSGLLGGPKGMLAPPPKLLGGPGPPPPFPPPPPPSSYAYVHVKSLTTTVSALRYIRFVFVVRCCFSCNQSSTKGEGWSTAS